MADSKGIAVSLYFAEDLARLYEQSPLHVVLYDPQDMVRYANPSHCIDFAMARDVPISWSDMMRHSYANKVGAAIQTDDIEAWLISAKARRGKLPFRCFEADLRSGQWMYITETMDEQGWMLSVGFDITALRTNDRSLRQARDGALRAAQVDALTGVSSRAHVLEQLDLRLNQLRGNQQPCGLVLLDLDYFKKINDTYGHNAGDEVLQRFARLVVSSLGRNDGFGRIGGEEFLLVLTDTGHDGALPFKLSLAQLATTFVEYASEIGRDPPSSQHPPSGRTPTTIIRRIETASPDFSSSTSDATLDDEEINLMVRAISQNQDASSVCLGCQPLTHPG